MPNLFRRYELLLPTQFNDGNRVPSDLIVDTLLELEEQFTAVSSETQLIQGRWRHENEVYRDELVREFVDVPDTVENRQFFVDFKERLKQRFQQIEIRITTYPLEVI